MRLTLNALSLLLLTACATISCKGVSVEICVLNEDGSAECVLSNKEEVSKTSEEMTNYICTNASDMEKLINACKKR